MKKKVVFVLLVFLFSFYCYAAESIKVPMIYNNWNERIIVFGDTVIPNQPYHCCAYDGKQQKFWLHIAEEHTSTFNQININGQIEETITITFGSFGAWDNGPFFVYDNLAVVWAYTEKNKMIIVNLETKEFKVFDLSKYKYYPVCGFRDNKVFFYSEYARKKIQYYDCLTGEVFDAETDLQGYGFMPLGNAYVGLNKKGQIVIQKFDTGEIIETKIWGIRRRPIGDVSDRYYMTEKYLYFSKKDKGYSFKHGIQLFFAKFFYDLNHEPIPHKWYRYSLETGKIEKIKTDDPYIDIIGVVEE